MEIRSEIETLMMSLVCRSSEIDTSKAEIWPMATGQALYTEMIKAHD